MIQFRCLLTIAAICACGITFVLAADATKPSTKSSLDAELLKGLENDLTSELDDLPVLKPKSKSSMKSDDKAPEQTPTTIIDGEDLGQLSEDRDPFSRIARKMRQVETRIARDQADAETQHKQQQIMDDLAALIDVLNKQCQCQGGECKPGEKQQASQRSNPNQSKQKSIEPSAKVAKSPATDSGDRLRNDVTAQASAEAIRQSMKEAWGNLPERIREQMLQTTVDEFLPKYELMIEQYFKRLAEEEPMRIPAEPERHGDATKIDQ